MKKKREVGWEERVKSPFTPLRLSPSPPPPPPPLFEPALQATVVQYSKGGNCYPTNKLKKRPIDSRTRTTMTTRFNFIRLQAPWKPVFNLISPYRGYFY